MSFDLSVAPRIVIQRRIARIPRPQLWATSRWGIFSEPFQNCCPFTTPSFASSPSGSRKEAFLQQGEATCAFWPAEVTWLFRLLIVEPDPRELRHDQSSPGRSQSSWVCPYAVLPRPRWPSTSPRTRPSAGSRYLPSNSAFHGLQHAERPDAFTIPTHASPQSE